MIAKPTSIKGTGGKSSGCGWKAIELSSGDLLHVTESRLRVERFTLTVRQKSAAGVLVAKAISEVDKGHYSAMKYLFEMIGLYPAASQEETQGEDSLARTLLRRLGLPQEPMLEAEITKDCELQPVADEEDAVK